MTRLSVALLGFGRRSPEMVLQFIKDLSLGLSKQHLLSIKFYGSQTLQHSLATPPYRVLVPTANLPMKDLKEEDDFDVVIFSLPTVVDYMKKGTNG